MKQEPKIYHHLQIMLDAPIECSMLPTGFLHFLLWLCRPISARTHECCGWVCIRISAGYSSSYMFMLVIPFWISQFSGKPFESLKWSIEEWLSGTINGELTIRRPLESIPSFIHITCSSHASQLRIACTRYILYVAIYALFGRFQGYTWDVICLWKGLSGCSWLMNVL